MNTSKYRYRPTTDPTAPRVREDPPLFGRAPGVSDEQFAEFLERVRAFEAAPTTTLARQLLRDGIELPTPETFTEATVRHKLHEIIQALARHRHYLTSTDHLSDLELYRYLWEITLNEPTEEIDARMGNCACIIDLVSDGSDESIWLWHRYYSCDEVRKHWAAEFPGDPMPERIDPPYDRDRHLPMPPWERPANSRR